MNIPTPLPEHGHGWGNTRFDRTLNGLVVESEVDVYPLNDIIPHSISGESCWCGARSEFSGSGGCIIYVHHSLDGRELAEDK